MTSENKGRSTVSRRTCCQVLSFALVTVFCLAGAARASAQTEHALKRFFEGKMVRVKIDMPATHDGIDVYPRKPTPVKWNDVSRRINRHGASIKQGSESRVTFIKKSDKRIEFHLDGGGLKGREPVRPAPLQKSLNETNMEQKLANEMDRRESLRLARELDSMQRSREEQDKQNLAYHRRELAAYKRLKLSSGSRFNVRFESRPTENDLMPTTIMDVLQEYVDFTTEETLPPTVSLSAEPSAVEPGGSTTLRWTSDNAESASFDQGIGKVRVSGLRQVSPVAKTTYTIAVKGEGGVASASTTVDVREQAVGPISTAVPIDELKLGIAKITNAKEGGGTDTGAGVVVGVDGDLAMIVTAFHVVEGAAEIKVHFPQKTFAEFQARLFTKISEEDELDIAVLIVGEGLGASIPEDFPEFRDGGSCAAGDEVLAIGHAQGLDWLPAPNNSIALCSDGDESRKLRFTKNGIGRGFSGGPLFDAQQRLWGIVTHIDPLHGVTVKIDTVTELLRGWGIPTNKLESGR